MICSLPTRVTALCFLLTAAVCPQTRAEIPSCPAAATTQAHPLAGEAAGAVLWLRTLRRDTAIVALTDQVPRYCATPFGVLINDQWLDGAKFLGGGDASTGTIVLAWLLELRQHERLGTSTPAHAAASSAQAVGCLLGQPAGRLSEFAGRAVEAHGILQPEMSLDAWLAAFEKGRLSCSR